MEGHFWKITFPKAFWTVSESSRAILFGSRSVSVASFSCLTDQKHKTLNLSALHPIHVFHLRKSIVLCMYLNTYQTIQAGVKGQFGKCFSANLKSNWLTCFVCVWIMNKLLNMKNILKCGRETDGGSRCRRFSVITCVYQNMQKNKNPIIISIILVIANW